MAHRFSRLFHLVRSSLLVCPARPRFQVCHLNCIMGRRPGQLCLLWRHWQQAYPIFPRASCAVGAETPLSRSEVYYLWLADTRMPGAFHYFATRHVYSFTFYQSPRFASRRARWLKHTCAWIRPVDEKRKWGRGQWGITFSLVKLW